MGNRIVINWFMLWLPWIVLNQVQHTGAMSSNAAWTMAVFFRCSALCNRGALWRADPIHRKLLQIKPTVSYYHIYLCNLCNLLTTNLYLNILSNYIGIQSPFYIQMVHQQWKICKQKSINALLTYIYTQYLTSQWLPLPSLWSPFYLKPIVALVPRKAGSIVTTTHMLLRQIMASWLYKNQTTYTVKYIDLLGLLRNLFYQYMNYG
jgi:hypothetical protein